MGVALYITGILLIAWQMGRKDLPVVLSVVGSCKSFSKTESAVMIPATLILGGLLWTLTGNPCLIPGNRLAVTLLAAFASVCVCSTISPYSPIIYAIGGALIGQELSMADSWNSHAVGTIAVWIMAPIAAVLLSSFIFAVYEHIAGQVHAHLVRMSHALSIIAIICLSIALAGTGLNLAPVFTIDAISTKWTGAAVSIVAILAAYFITRPFRQRVIEELRNEVMDINPGAAISILLSTGIVMVLCSSAVLNRFGIEASPLSPSLMMFAGLTGCRFAQRSPSIDRETIFRTTVTAVLTPALALLTAYYVSPLFDTSVRPNNPDTWLQIVTLALFIASVLMAGDTMSRYLATRRAEKRLMDQEDEISANRRSLNELEVKNMRIENENLHNLLERKRQEVMSIALNISEQREFIDSIYDEVLSTRSERDPEKKDEILHRLQLRLNQRRNLSSEIDGFYAQVEQVHKDFSIRLSEKYPELTEQEKRLTTLLRLGFSTKYIASLMSISPKSVEINRHRLRAKLGLTRQQNLTAFIKTI